MNYFTRKHTSGFLFVLLGALISGLGVGLALGQPAFGLIIGLGAGLLIWGLISALKG